jgi:hypothetical protein
MKVPRGFTWNHPARLCTIFSAALLAAFVPNLMANQKPTEVPAQVIAHMILKEAPGSEMLLQTKSDKQYLYIQKASKDGFTVVDVTKPSVPAFVKTSAASSEATSGKLEMVGPDVAIAAVPDKNAKGMLHSVETPTQTIKVLQTFNNVTSTLQDPGRGLIYLANNEGLWILRHARPGITPSKKKRPCGSEDAIASMPPDCE